MGGPDKMPYFHGPVPDALTFDETLKALQQAGKVKDEAGLKAMAQEGALNPRQEGGEMKYKREDVERILGGKIESK